jgi:hypothetical protein
VSELLLRPVERRDEPGEVVAPDEHLVAERYYFHESAPAGEVDRSGMNGGAAHRATRSRDPQDVGEREVEVLGERCGNDAEIRAAVDEGADQHGRLVVGRCEEQRDAGSRTS